MDRPIKKFSSDGHLGDEKDMARIRGAVERELIETMRDCGYVPHLDLDRSWTTSYDGGIFNFTSTIYGVYVGTRKALENEGVIGNGKFVPRVSNRGGTEGNRG